MGCGASASKDDSLKAQKAVSEKHLKELSTATAEELAGTPLEVAAQKGDAKEVKQLIDARADLNVTNKFGHTPLHGAAANGHSEAAEALLAAGADLENVDKHGSRPLMYASFHPAGLATVEVLLSARADVNATSAHTKRTTLMSLAIGKGDPAVMKVLLDAKADVNATSDAGCTPLYHADPVAMTLLLEAKANVNVANEAGLTPLHNAALKGLSGAVEVLLAAGANAEVVCKQGARPLMYASTYQDKDIFTVGDLVSLSEEGSVVESGYDWSNDALAPGDVGTIVKITDSFGIRGPSGRQNWYGKKDIQVSKQVAAVPTVEALLTARADVNAKAIAGNRTALMGAALVDNPAVLKLLLDAKADVTVKGFDGTTALSAATGECRNILARLGAPGGGDGGRCGGGGGQGGGEGGGDGGNVSLVAGALVSAAVA